MSDNRRRTTTIEHAARERVVTALAAGQGGYFSRAQLLDAGFSDNAIRYRLEAGRYVCVHHGVYGVAPVRTDLPGLAWAAVLACGVGALASHLTAAALWAFIRHFALPLHVTAPVLRTRPGIITHRSSVLTRADIARQRGVPVTSRARTVLDITPLLPTRQVRRIVNDHAREGRLRLDALTDVVARNPRHPAARTLTSILDDTQYGLTRSDLEDDFLAFVKAYNLPIPIFDTPLHGVEVDAYYPAHNLVIELDTLDYHGDPDAFETDRERDAVHLANGTPTLRITGERLKQQPQREADRLNAILAARDAAHTAI